MGPVVGVGRSHAIEALERRGHGSLAAPAAHTVDGDFGSRHVLLAGKEEITPQVNT